MSLALFLACASATSPAQVAPFDLLVGLGPTFSGYGNSEPGWGFFLGVGSNFARPVQFAIECSYKRFDQSGTVTRSAYPNFGYAPRSPLETIEVVFRLDVPVRKELTRPIVSLGYGVVQVLQKRLSGEYVMIGAAVEHEFNSTVSGIMGSDLCFGSTLSLSVPVFFKLKIGL